MKILLSKSYRIIKDIVLKEIKQNTGYKVLDIGCGIMGNFWGLPKEAYVGIDKNKSVIRRFSSKENGTYHIMDAGDIQFEEKSFDYIVSVSFFHHISDNHTKNIFSGIKRVVKNGGKIIIADGVYPVSKINLAGQLIRFFDRGRHVRNKEDFRKIFASDFLIDKDYYFLDKIFAYSILVMKMLTQEQERDSA